MEDELPEVEPRRGAQVGLLVLALVAAVLLGLRPLWTPRVPEGWLVEVVGAVERPGIYVAERGTLAGALEAAGIEMVAPETPLAPGDRVVVTPELAWVTGSDDPVLLGGKVDPNRASALALAGIPGVTATLAQAIVDDRLVHGEFAELGDLDRVKGVGPSTLRQMAPLLAIRGELPPEDPPPHGADPPDRPRKKAPRGPRQPVDINQADAGALQTLPKVGPALAERIVADRALHGPYERAEDLDRVTGIGPATVEVLRDYVVFGEVTGGAH